MLQWGTDCCEVKLLSQISSLSVRMLQTVNRSCPGKTWWEITPSRQFTWTIRVATVGVVIIKKQCNKFFVPLFTIPHSKTHCRRLLWGFLFRFASEIFPGTTRIKYIMGERTKGRTKRSCTPANLVLIFRFTVGQVINSVFV